MAKKSASEGVYRVIDVIGTSKTSWEDAARSAVETAGSSLRDLRVAEIAPPGKKGFYVSWQSASQQVAVVFAAMIGVVLGMTLSVDQLAAWGWRIPLGLGCLIIPLLFLMRRHLRETDILGCWPTLGIPGSPSSACGSFGDSPGGAVPGVLASFMAWLRTETVRRRLSGTARRPGRWCPPAVRPRRGRRPRSTRRRPPIRREASVAG